MFHKCLTMTFLIDEFMVNLVLYYGQPRVIYMRVRWSVNVMSEYYYIEHFILNRNELIINLPT